MSTNKEFSQFRLSFWTNLLRDAMLVEGKHWPEDYIKTALNMLKKDGKYDDNPKDPEKLAASQKIKDDVQKIAQRFRMVLHGNSPLGYFNTVVRWYADDPKDFIQMPDEENAEPTDKLQSVLTQLRDFLNNQALVDKHDAQVKNGNMPLKDFSAMMKKVSDEDAKNAANVKFSIRDNGYKIIPFMSYEKLHEQFGGDKTGYKGESEWCHTNGVSTYDSWTENFKKFFFVIAKDNWQEIKPHENPKEDDNAYDDYGLSLMAILVSDKGRLLNCTLRWNHVVGPKYTKPGRAVDNAFISYAELSQVTGFDVEAEVKNQLAKILEKVKKIPKGEKVYDGPKGICFANDHFYWYDKDFNPIDPPNEIETGIEIIMLFDSELTSLVGSPNIVNGNFICSSTPLETLKGAPRTVIGSFDCSATKITSLEGGPEEIDGDFWCTSNELHSLEGAPRSVGGNVYASDTGIRKYQLEQYLKWLESKPKSNYHTNVTDDDIL